MAAGCPSDDALAEHVTRGASGEEATEDGDGGGLAAHVAGCDECREAVARITALAFEATAFAGVSADAEIPASVRAGAVLAPGTPVGRYEIVELVGAGGMGAVYAAHDPELDRRVALKILRADASHGPHAAALRRRLAQEAKAMARLSHPNVVTIYDTGSYGDQIFIAMELVDGQTLRAWLEEQPRSWRAVLAALGSVGRGLAAAHEAGIIHRDVKPDNVLVSRDGRVLVTDFGLAGDATREEAELGGAPPMSQAPSSRLTKTGATLGTPAYMAPEILHGARADARSDLFGFCVTAYEALYGVRPYEGATLRELLERARAGVPRPPVAGRSVSGAPGGVRAALRSGLDPDPAARPASMRALLASMDGAQRRARMWRLAAVGVAALAGGIAASLAVARAHHAPLPTPRGARPVIAVFDLRPEGEDDRARWIGAAVADALRADLAVGEQIRAASGEATARLGETDARRGQAPSPDVVARARDRAGADYVLAGTCGAGAAAAPLLSLGLYRTDTGARVAAWEERAEGGRILDAAARASEHARAELGIAQAQPGELAKLNGAFPSRVDAVERYASGMAHLRVFDAATARRDLEKAAELEPNAPLVHAGLAEALRQLGEQRRARVEAERAFSLGAGLTRELRLSLEGLYRETAGEWERAVEIDRALWTFFPDNPEYGLRLAAAQVKAPKLKEAAQSIDELRRLPPPDGSDPRVDLVESELYRRQGENAHARDAARRARGKADAAEMLHLAAQAVYLEALAEDNLGQGERALAIALDAERSFHATGDLLGEANARNLQAKFALSRGDATEAARLLEGNVAIGKALGSDERTASALSNLGIVRHAQGDVAAARALLLQAIPLCESAGDRYGLAQGMENVALVLCDMGDLDGALAQHKASIELRRAMDDRRGVAVASVGLAMTLRERGDDAGARKARDEAHAIAAALDEREVIADVEIERARAALEDGATDDAIRSLLVVVGARGEHAASADVGVAKAALARAYAQAGRPPAEILELVRVGREAAASNRSIAWHAEVDGGLARVAVGGVAEAREEAARLEADVEQERGRGCVLAELHLRLALARVEARFDPPAATKRLSALAADARTRGFVGIANRAR